jgi:hypothetical protein
MDGVVNDRNPTKTAPSWEEEREVLVGRAEPNRASYVTIRRINAAKTQTYETPLVADMPEVGVTGSTRGIFPKARLTVNTIFRGADHL